MPPGHWYLHQAWIFVHFNRGWMVWNVLLAALPVLIAVLLARRPAVRSPFWWFGVAVFILFLPNAPYLLTDLIHLPWSMRMAPSRGLALGLVLPTYVLLVALGFVLYWLALREVDRFLVAQGKATWRRPVELALHLLCAIGVVMGRIARLNSWDSVTHPRGTIQLTLATLDWHLTPIAVPSLFLAFWAGYRLTDALASGLGRVISRVAGRLPSWT